MYIGVCRDCKSIYKISYNHISTSCKMILMKARSSQEMTPEEPTMVNMNHLQQKHHNPCIRKPLIMKMPSHATPYIHTIHGPTKLLILTRVTLTMFSGMVQVACTLHEYQFARVLAGEWDQPWTHSAHYSPAYSMYPQTCVAALVRATSKLQVISSVPR